jgi:hypothetical protein
MQADTDERILAQALSDNRTVISADSDFGILLAFQRARQPSFILFKEDELTSAEDFADVPIPALPGPAAGTRLRLHCGLPFRAPSCPPAPHSAILNAA